MEGKPLSGGRRNIIILAGLLLIMVVIFYLLIDGITPLQFDKDLPSFSAEPLQIDNVLYFDRNCIICGRGERLEGYRPDNFEPLWGIKPGFPVKKIWNTDGGFILDTSKGIEMFDPAAKKTLWRFSAGEGPQRLLDVCGGFSLMEGRIKGEEEFNLFFIDDKGELKWNFPLNSETLINGCIASDGEYIAVSTLKVQNSINGKIIMFNSKGELLWAKVYDDELITFLNFNKDGELTALKENTLAYFHPSGQLKKEQTLGGQILRASASREGYLVLCRRESPESNILKGGRNVLELYNPSGRRQWQVELDHECRDIKITDDGRIIIALLDNSVLALTVRGEFIGEYRTDFSINGIVTPPEGIPFIINHAEGSALINNY
jgi:hypothetical protein